MNTIVVHGVSGLVAGMMYGAIGASVGENARNKPVLKGALVAGAIGGTAATVLGAVRATSAGRIPAGNVTGAYFP